MNNVNCDMCKRQWLFTTWSLGTFVDWLAHSRIVFDEMKVVENCGRMSSSPRCMYIKLQALRVYYLLSFKTHSKIWSSKVIHSKSWRSWQTTEIIFNIFASTIFARKDVCLLFWRCIMQQSDRHEKREGNLTGLAWRIWETIVFTEISWRVCQPHSLSL